MKKTDLRQQAEAKLSKRKKSPATETDSMRLIHDLDVHQIELEMQNEQLIQARAEAEAIHRQYTDLYDFAPIGYFTLTCDGTIRMSNLTGANLLGAERSKLVKHRFGVFVSIESRLVFNAFLEKIFTTGKNEDCEIMLLKEGHESCWVRLDAVCSEDRLECRVVMKDITERKRTELELKKVNEQLRTLTNYWQTSIEAERTTIAREIHDDFGQSMTALKMDLNWLENRLPKDDKRIERIHGMNKLVDDSITLMRRIATQLRPNLLDDLGLNAALEWQAKEFSRRSGIRCGLNLPEIDLDLNPNMSTSVFRIFQESLTNINRHAQATQVTVTLEQKDRTMILTIQDDGRGIIEKEITASHSLGLLGMRERAAQWGGEVNIQGAPGKGTTVTVRIPLPVSTVEGGKQ